MRWFEFHPGHQDLFYLYISMGCILAAGLELTGLGSTKYGLASFRLFQTRSFLFDESDEESDASKADVK